MGKAASTVSSPKPALMTMLDIELVYLRDGKVEDTPPEIGLPVAYAAARIHDAIEQAAA